MKTFLLAPAILCCCVTHAQDSLKIFIGADQQVSDIITPKKIYKYTEFKPGRITFRDGSIANDRFNYNYLNGEIEFIQKDTLAIAKDQMLNIRFLTVGSDTFFYDKGYLQLVAQTPGSRLLKKEMLVVSKREKIGAYNQPSQTSAIESYGSFTDNFGGFTPNLKIHENITLTLRTDWYVADRYNTFLLANKRNLQKLFPGKRKQIDSYLTAHPVDFKRPEDIRSLLAALN